MSASFVFPTRLFRPKALQVRLVGAALSGGASISGDAQFADLSGGGRWVMDFGETTLWTPSLVKKWRALSAATDSGAQKILVPIADRRHQPVTPAYTGPDTFGLAIYDAGLTPFSPDEVTAIPTADAALGTTELTFDYTAPVALEGGEHFSIEHPSWGWRLYRITRVKSGGLGSGDATVVDFRPPLREAVGAADSPTPYLNFDSPRCLMRVEGEMDLTLDMLRRGSATARFVEAGKPD